MNVSDDDTLSPFWCYSSILYTSCLKLPAFQLSRTISKRTIHGFIYDVYKCYGVKFLGKLFISNRNMYIFWGTFALRQCPIHFDPLIIYVWKAKWAKCISYLCAYSFSWLIAFSGWFMATAHAHCIITVTRCRHFRSISYIHFRRFVYICLISLGKQQQQNNPKVHRILNWPIEWTTNARVIYAKWYSWLHLCAPGDTLNYL